MLPVHSKYWEEWSRRVNKWLSRPVIKVEQHNWMQHNDKLNLSMPLLPDENMQLTGKKSAHAQFKARVGLAEWIRKGITTNYSDSGIHKDFTSPPVAKRGTSHTADTAALISAQMPLTPGESLTPGPVLQQLVGLGTGGMMEIELWKIGNNFWENEC